MSSIEFYPDLLKCPICMGVFNSTQQELVCQNCASRWPIKSGIPDFRADQTYFYDFEYSKEGMDELLRHAREQGWMDALKNSRNKFGHKPSDYFVLYNSSPDRAPWIDMLPIGPNSSALDFGCGMGTVSMTLAEKFGRVISFDPSFERAEFLSIRRDQQNKSNVLVVAWDGIGAPPFKTQSFDAVVLNGVLEWTPESIRSGNPRDVQIEVLSSVYSLLKPGGKVYVGIENRFAVEYFFGRPDHHSDLRFVTLMPRTLANVYSWILKGTSYRVHTHSLFSYYKMFSEAGFSQVDGYEAYPRYMFPKDMIPLHDEKKLHDVRSGHPNWQDCLIRSLSRLGLAKYFVYCFGFVAIKGSAF